VATEESLFSAAMQAPGKEPEVVRITSDGLDKIRPVWTSDGKSLLFARHESDGLRVFQYVLSVDEREPARRLTKRALPEYQGVCSPDGKTVLLVTVTQQGTQGNLNLSRIGLEGGDPVSLVPDPGPNHSHQEWPAWSPDGERFAFSSTHEGNQEIYTAKMDGSDIKRLTQNPGLDAHPCYTPDGRRIVFSTDRWSGVELASMSIDGSDVRRITDSPGFDDYPAVSPDGLRIAFVSRRDGNYEIYTCSLDGSESKNRSNHTARDTFPSWSRDGKSLVFVSDRSGEGADLYEIRVESP
jgi:TolB protein